MWNIGQLFIELPTNHFSRDLQKRFVSCHKIPTDDTRWPDFFDFEGHGNDNKYFLLQTLPDINIQLFKIKCMYVVVN